MPLILAIEPDRKQASQLTAMVRGRLRAEFVLGESAERALAALGERVPDLILTSALLSPKDETALGERLRALDGAAAHVQTLTIPVLASANGRAHGGSKAGGVLSALRRDKAKSSAPEGCDPSVFAEQCKEYLERAATERVLLEERAAALAKPIEDAVEEIAKPELAAAVDEFRESPQSMTQPSADPVLEKPVPDAFALEPAVLPASPEAVVPSAVIRIELDETRTEPVEAVHHESPHVQSRERFAIPGDEEEGPASLLAAVAAFTAEEEEPAPAIGPEPAAPEPEEFDRHDEFVDLDLSELLDEQSTRGTRAARSGQREFANEEEAVQVYELDASAFEVELQASAAAFAAAPGEEEPQPTVSETELYTALPDAAARRWPVLAVGEEAPQPAPAPSEEPDEMKEWLDIIEALRRDAQQVPVARATPPPEPQQPDAAAKRKRKRPSNTPAQDEWGFFDPEQCGFAALLAKLEEITEQDDVSGV